MNKCYRLDIYIPDTHLEQVKQAVFDAGAGRIGNYDSCCWQTKGDGQFRALEGSQAFIGQKNRLESVVEYKVELVCDLECIDDVIAALKNAHPYETPAFQYWLVNF